MTSSTKGSLIAALSFVLYGLLPLYYHFLPGANMNELLAFRILSSVPTMMLLILLVTGKNIDFMAIWRDKRSLLLCLVASLVMSVSWYAFTWALTNQQVLAASLGFFINPLMAIALGALCLKERLSPGQKIAVVLALIAIGLKVLFSGELPMLALLMATFFALYGLVKKFIRYDALTAVTVEAIVLVPIALPLVLFWHIDGNLQASSEGASLFWLFVGVGPVSLIPLVLFSLAVERTSLTMIGLMQYIEPSLQFILATLLFGELFDLKQGITFGLIWLGLLICTREGWLNHRLRQRRAQSQTLSPQPPNT